MTACASVAVLLLYSTSPSVPLSASNSSVTQKRHFMFPPALSEWDDLFIISINKSQWKCCVKTLCVVRHKRDRWLNGGRLQMLGYWCVNTFSTTLLYQRVTPAPLGAGLSIECFQIHLKCKYYEYECVCTVIDHARTHTLSILCI